MKIKNFLTLFCKMGLFFCVKKQTLKFFKFSYAHSLMWYTIYLVKAVKSFVEAKYSILFSNGTPC